MAGVSMTIWQSLPTQRSCCPVAAAVMPAAPMSTRMAPEDSFLQPAEAPLTVLLKLDLKQLSDVTCLCVKVAIAPW